MKILKRDKKTGTMKLKLENPTDLWHLDQIVEEGDFIRAKTRRSKTIKRGQKVEYGEKRAVTLTIELEKKKFRKRTGRLRLTGQIKEAPEGFPTGYHTIEARPGLVITIRKERWSKHQLKRLEEAKMKEPLILICMLDRESARFTSLKGNGPQYVGEEYRPKPEKKPGETIKKEKVQGFYKTIADYLSQKKKYERIVLAGPGFEKENLYRYIKKNKPELAQKIILESASSTTVSGVNEVLKKSGDRLLKQTRAVRETQLIQKIWKEIQKEGKITYGQEQVKKAVEMGAVEKLVISSQALKDNEDLLKQTENQGGEVEIISTTHEAGEQFLHLGGIAAFLRFRV